MELLVAPLAPGDADGPGVGLHLADDLHVLPGVGLLDLGRQADLGPVLHVEHQLRRDRLAQTVVGRADVRAGVREGDAGDGVPVWRIFALFIV